jgi:hypothetical protein
MNFNDSRTAELLEAAIARGEKSLESYIPGGTLPEIPLEIKATILLVCQMTIADLLGCEIMCEGTRENKFRQTFDLMTALLAPDLRLSPTGKAAYNRISAAFFRDLSDMMR